MNRVELHTHDCIPPIEKGFSGTWISKDGEKSTIEESKKQAFSFEASKPMLPSPLWDLVGKVQRLEACADDHSLIREREIENHMKELNRLHAQESLQMDKALAAQKTVTFWTVLQDIGNILMGTISTLTGIFTVSTANPVVGGMLIAAGLTSIANVAFKYGNVWDWLAEKIAKDNKNLRETIRTFLPAGIALVCSVFCIYGSFQVWNLPGLTSSAKFISMLETASNLALGVANLGKGIAGANLKWETAELSALQTMEEFTRMDLENATEETQEFQKRQFEIKKTAAHLINANNDALSLINQPV